MKISSISGYALLIMMITIIMGVMYVAVQQSYRTAANDPQIQMARNLGTEILQGKPVKKSFLPDTIDIANDLSPFVTLYDATGSPFLSTGFLNGHMPKLPIGIFDVAKNSGEYSVTWQPQPRVRVALVLLHINSVPDQFVAAGRSLTEVEVRESSLRKMILTGWLICFALISLHSALKYYTNNKNQF